MMALNRISNLIEPVLYWAARLLSLLSIGLLFAFILGDGVAPGAARPTPGEWVLLAFFPLGVIAGMVVGWWREGLGGAITVGSLLAFYLVFFILGRGMPRGVWFLLFALPGFLFLAHWLLTRAGKV